jgi:hypothetical protein
MGVFDVRKRRKKILDSQSPWRDNGPIPAAKSVASSVFGPDNCWNCGEQHEEGAWEILHQETYIQEVP